MPREWEVGGTVYEFPDDYDDAKVTSILKSQGVLSLPDDFQVGDPDFTPSAFGQVMGSIQSALAAPFMALRHPVETGKGLYGAQKEQFTKAGEEYKAGNLANAFRRSLAGATPLLGPAIENTAEKATTGGRPWEAAADVALMALPTVPKLGSIPARTASAVSKSASKNYLSTLLPNKRGVPKAEQTAAFLAEQRPVAMTREGFIDLTKAKKAATGPAAAAAYSSVPALGQSELAPIYADLNALRDKHVYVRGSTTQVNPNLAKALDNLEYSLLDLEDAKGMIAAETLDDFRDKLFRGAVSATGDVRQTAPAAAKTIEKSVASSIRRVLDDKSPSAARANAEYHLWSKAYEFLEDARRQEIASKASVIKGSSQGFGALTQRMLPRPVRQIPQKIAGLFDSVAWNTISGATKSRFAELVASGSFDKAYNLILGLRKPVAAGAAIKINLNAQPMPPAPLAPPTQVEQ